MMRLRHFIRIFLVLLGSLSHSNAEASASSLTQALAAQRLSATRDSDPRTIIRLVLGETRILVRELVRHYPPGQWFYLCVGRSPTPLAEGLRLEAGEDSVRTIPISGAKWLNPVEIADPILPQWVEAADFLARVLPTREELGGRKVLVIDYSNTGASFNNQMEIIDRVFKRRDQAAPLMRGRAYYYRADLMSLMRLGEGVYSVEYSRAPELLADAWMATDFDGWAEYDEWRPSQDSGPPRKNDRYPLFRKAFRRWWKQGRRACESPLQIDPPKLSF